jgi:hypothetical protein
MFPGMALPCGGGFNITGLGSPMPMEKGWTCMLKPARNSS